MELKYIDKIGVEMEGAWDEKPEKLYEDVSVTCRGNYHGETCSPPSVYHDLEKYIKNNCPDYVDPSCGLHVHISFKSVNDYLRLTDKAFHDFFKQEMKKFGESMGYKATHRFFNRLSGKNKFCNDEFRPDDQIYLKTKADARRTHLNYCYSLHGTIECRLFPSYNNPTEVMEAVKAFISCVEKYLENNPPLPSNYPEVLITTEDLSGV